MKKLQLVSAMALAFGALALSSTTNAAVVGESSNTAYVKVGTAVVNGGPHTSGGAGIGVNATGIDSLVNFQGLTAYGAEDPQGVYTLNFPYTGAPDSHDALGVFNFAQVGTNDVWIGEWSAYGTSGDDTRTVYYSGANADTSVPTTGTADYTVVGINNYDGTAASLLGGTLTANFGTSTLTGIMYNSTFTKVIDLGTATINSDASVTSIATDKATGTFGSTSLTNGDVSAQFYNGQADLAGLVDFAGTDYDTAFGATKD